MHILSSMQAVAHGADAVQYFQWRKSRGSVENSTGRLSITWVILIPASGVK
jgi:beta-galactosidase GanA